MTEEEKEFHSLTRMEQLRIAEKHIAKLEAQLADQPKPTGGEWTLGESNPRVVWRGDAVIGIAINHEESARFIDAHNAALAAEREKARHWQERFDDKERQLAEMTNDRDRWRDMAHGEPTKRPAWEKR